VSSIEEQARSLRDRALVVARLCDAASQGSWNGRWSERRREAGFWNGLESLVDEFISFLERLPRVVSDEILNLEMPPEGSPFYDGESQGDDARIEDNAVRRVTGRPPRGPRANRRRDGAIRRARR
jgi:hypothetical protein